MKYLKELGKMIEAGKLASKKVLEIYHSSFHVEIKDDKSPVTEADKESDKLIRNFLHKEFPSYSFLTEESEDDKSRLNAEFIFIVDPLDGTKDFVNYDDEFSINIALCHFHEIVASVTVIPVVNLLYYSIKNGGSYKLDLKTNECKKIFVSSKLSNLKVYKSRYHSFENEERVFQKYKDILTDIECCGSAYKLCKIAEGEGELSYRLNLGTKEWDTASFTLLIEEAGGKVLDLDQKRITYNRENVKNGCYIVLNDIRNWYL